MRAAVGKINSIPVRPNTDELISLPVFWSFKILRAMFNVQPNFWLPILICCRQVIARCHDKCWYFPLKCAVFPL